MLPYKSINHRLRVLLTFFLSLLIESLKRHQICKIVPYLSRCPLRSCTRGKRAVVLDDDRHRLCSILTMPIDHDPTNYMISPRYFKIL